MLTLITPPTVPAVTLAEAKANSRVTEPDEDALIAALVETATQEAEHHMSRAIMPQQWKLTLDGFCDDVIYLRRPIVTAVNSIKYIDTSGVQQTLPGTEYVTDLGGELISRVSPAFGKTWPATQVRMNAVEILFTCGWADAASVPTLIKSWIMQRASALFENREAWVVGKSVERNRYTDQLLARWTVRSF